MIDLEDNLPLALKVIEFYNNPQDEVIRGQLERYHLLESVDQYVDNVAALTGDDFLSNGKWTGIPEKALEWLPTLTFKVLRNTDGTFHLGHIGVVQQVVFPNPVGHYCINANELQFLDSTTTSNTINLELPTHCLTYNHIRVFTDNNMSKVHTTVTLLPEHIDKVLNKKMIDIVFQEKLYRIFGGCMGLANPPESPVLQN